MTFTSQQHHLFPSSLFAPSHPSRLNIDVGVFDVGERAASVCLLPHAQFPIPGQPFFTKYDALSSCFSRARNKSESQFSCLFLFFVRAGLDVASFCSWQLKNISRKKVGRVCLHCLSHAQTIPHSIFHILFENPKPRVLYGLKSTISDFKMSAEVHYSRV